MKNSIEKLIQELGTQKEVALKYNVTQQTVSQWLHLGRIPYKIASVIAKDMNIPVHYLCDKDPTPPQY